MTESMDALDKMVLGEATGQMVNGGLEETVTVKLEESVDSKTEEVDSEGGDEISHDHSAANASTATNQELDEVGCLAYFHVVHRRHIGDLDGSICCYLTFLGTTASSGISEPQGLGSMVF